MLESHCFRLNHKSGQLKTAHQLSNVMSLSFLRVISIVTLHLTLGWKVQILVSYIITFVVKQLSNYMLSSTALRSASDTSCPF
jgi:hypothetical protein